jgi:hypothetical protein
MTFLKAGFRIGLFAVGLVASGDWHKTVLNTYAINCTMLPHPAPYPYHLLRLAEGKPTIKGLKELLACDYEPLSGREKLLEWPLFFWNEDKGQPAAK